MSLQETATFVTHITLSTANGELPDDTTVRKLIEDQMSGELDETTGLFCVDVKIDYRTTLDIQEER